MTFSELLSLTAGATVFIFAFMEGKKAGGALGMAVGLLLGLAIGSGVFWGTWRALKWAIQRLNLQEPNLPPVRLVFSWLICISVFVGAIAFGILTSWVTRMVIRAIQ